MRIIVDYGEIYLCNFGVGYHFYQDDDGMTNIVYGEKAA